MLCYVMLCYVMLCMRIKSPIWINGTYICIIECCIHFLVFFYINKKQHVKLRNMLWKNSIYNIFVCIANNQCWLLWKCYSLTKYIPEQGKDMSIVTDLCKPFLRQPLLWLSQVSSCSEHVLTTRNTDCNMFYLFDRFFSILRRYDTIRPGFTFVICNNKKNNLFTFKRVKRKTTLHS